jgi:hypothetical protein
MYRLFIVGTVMQAKRGAPRSLSISRNLSGLAVLAKALAFCLAASHWRMNVRFLLLFNDFRV